MVHFPDLFIFHRFISRWNPPSPFIAFNVVYWLIIIFKTNGSFWCGHWLFWCLIRFCDYFECYIIDHKILCHHNTYFMYLLLTGLYVRPWTITNPIISIHHIRCGVTCIFYGFKLFVYFLSLIPPYFLFVQGLLIYSS